MPGAHTPAPNTTHSQSQISPLDVCGCQPRPKHDGTHLKCNRAPASPIVDQELPCTTMWGHSVLRRRNAGTIASCPGVKGSIDDGTDVWHLSASITSCAPLTHKLVDTHFPHPTRTAACRWANCGRHTHQSTPSCPVHLRVRDSGRGATCRHRGIGWHRLPLHSATQPDSATCRPPCTVQDVWVARGARGAAARCTPSRSSAASAALSVAMT